MDKSTNPKLTQALDEFTNNPRLRTAREVARVATMEHEAGNISTGRMKKILHEVEEYLM